jgi:hypothetical protein
MEEFDNYIKKCNLVFTKTSSRSNLEEYGFDINKIDINYDNSISLFSLIEDFNKLYLDFKKEYDELEKLDLGNFVELISFNKYSVNDNNYRVLKFYINDSHITPTDTFLYLREINGKIKPFVTNDYHCSDKKYFYKDINLNREISRKYLDLFEKYNSLLAMYNYLKYRRLFGDGSSSLFTVIDNHHSNLLNGLNTFRILFAGDYLDTDFCFDLSVTLGNNLELNKDKCKLFLDYKDSFTSKDKFDGLLNNVYINKDYLIDTKNINSNKKLIKTLTNC